MFYRLPRPRPPAASSAARSISPKSSWNRWPTRADVDRNFSQQRVTHYVFL
jgi:hypothetical protein